MPLKYLKEIFNDYRVGAVTRSSRFVVDKVVSEIRPSDKKIVEYGSGDGVVIKALLNTLPEDAELAGLEPNDNFTKELSKISDPRFKAVQDYAVNFSKNLKDVDVIISSIPFTFIKQEEREEIVKETYRALAPGGKFIVYQYSQLSLPLLKKYFSRVETSIEARNLPPYFFMIAYK
jgi:phosphatidylethanolamine/phosphatidyl-N-methylethanolamine N-methyltransferase